MSDQLHIEELFKRKLEGLEETPSARAWEKTARAVRRKQFWQFRPGRMNIFYVSGLVVTVGLIAVLIADKAPEPFDHQAPTTDTILIESDSLEQQVIKKEPSDSGSGLPGQQEHLQQASPLEEIPTTKSTSAAEKAPSEADERTISPPTEFEPVHTLVAYFIPSATEGCAPLTVTLINTSINAVVYDWSTGGQIMEHGDLETVVTFDRPGTYAVILTAIDANGLSRSHSDQITVHPTPTAEFEIAEGNIFNYSTGATEYLWESYSSDYKKVTSQFQPPADDFLAGDSIMLIATNIFGCADSTTGAIPLPLSPTLRFPSAFSPNPDGATGGYYNPNEPNNRVFYPTYNEAPATYNLKIFSKSGELIFETNEIDRGWDGYYKDSPAPRGVYIYQCTGTWANGDAFNYRGDITVLPANF